MATDDDKLAWLERVLGVKLGAASGGDTGGAADGTLDLSNRMAAATRQVDALKAEGDPALPTLLAAHADAMAAKGPQAGEAMDALEAALARAASASRGRAAEAGNTGKVAYAKLLLRWHEAQTRVDDNLKALGQALLNDPAIRNDPDFDQIEEAVGELPDLVPDLGQALDDVLDAARDPSADTEALHRDALGIIASYRSALGQVSALQDLEPFAAQTSAGKIALFSEFSAALNDLEVELSKAA